MTKLSEENLIRVVQLMISSAKYADVMRAACDGSESLLYVWRSACLRDKAKGDISSPYYICYRNEFGWWTDFCEASRREFQLSYIDLLKSQAATGITSVVRDSTQNILYELDPEFIGLSDDMVELITGCGPGGVARARLLLDENGNPKPQLKTEQLPAPLRLRAAEVADPRWRSVTHQNVAVEHSGVVQISKPLTRLPTDPPARSQAELREMLKLPRAERLAKLGASAYPVDANGRKQIPLIASPPLNERADDQGHGLRPPPESTFVKPQPTPAQEAPPKSYARPNPSLDSSGRGDFNPPPGGGRANAPGNVR